MDARTLDGEIAKVCPIIGCTVGDTDDRASWTYTPTSEATAQELAAADNVIATIPVEVPPSVAPANVVLLDHEQRLRVIEVATGLRKAE